jgi:hypothetical protein
MFVEDISKWATMSSLGSVCVVARNREKSAFLIFFIHSGGVYFPRQWMWQNFQWFGNNCLFFLFLFFWFFFWFSNISQQFFNLFFFKDLVHILLIRLITWVSDFFFRDIYIYIYIYWIIKVERHFNFIKI